MLRFIYQLFYNLFIAVDQLLNALLLGHPDETLSSRLGRAKGKERYFWVEYLRFFVDLIFYWDTEKKWVTENTYIILKHCEKSVMPLEQLNFRTVVDYELWSWEK